MANDHNCLHEQDIGRFLQICNAEIPEIKQMLTGIYNSLEGNGNPGLKTRTALLEGEVRDIRSDFIGMPCALRATDCKKEFESIRSDVKTDVKSISDKLSSPRRMAAQATILTFSGFAGGFVAMWTIARFYLPDLIANRLPGIVRELLPALIK